MGKSVTDPLVELVGEEAYQGFEPWDFALDLAPVFMAYSFVSEALVNLIFCRDRSFFSSDLAHSTNHYPAGDD